MKKIYLILAMVLMTTSLCSAFAAAEGAFVDPALTGKTGTVKVIVNYNALESTAINALRENGATVSRAFKNVKAIAAEIPAEKISLLAHNRYITGIYEDKMIKVDPINATLKALSKKELKPMLAQAKNRLNVQPVWDMGFDGKGVKIAVLDTGIDWNHPGLVGKVAESEDFVLWDGRYDAKDYLGHGTHVAGIIAGSGVGSVEELDLSYRDYTGMNIPNEWLTPTFDIPIETTEDKGAVLSVPALEFVPEDKEYKEFVNMGDKGFFINAWAISDTETHFSVSTAEGSTFEFEIDDNNVYNIVIDGIAKSAPSEVGATENGVFYAFAQGSSGDYIRLARNEQMVYLDKDKDYSTHDDQTAALVGQVFSQTVLYANGGSGGSFGMPLTLFNIDSNIATVGIDADSDGAPDIFRGIAPGAQLYNAKVLSDDGGGYWSDVMSGIEWAIEKKIDIISMSLGGWDYYACNAPWDQEVQKAADEGIIVTIAAGNSGDEKRTISSPGCSSGAITVGAQSLTGSVADFSSRGLTKDVRIKPDMIAPGESVFSAVPSDSLFYSWWNSAFALEYLYVPLSGTSMATPMVAGAAALIKQQWPTQTPEEIKDILMASAYDVGENIESQGAGAVNVTKAFKILNNTEKQTKPSKIEKDLMKGNDIENTIQIETGIDTPNVDFEFYTRAENTSEKTITFAGDVSRASSYKKFTFELLEDKSMITVNLNWTNSANDIDLCVESPSGYKCSWAEDTNSENVIFENAKAGEWIVEVMVWRIVDSVVPFDVTVGQFDLAPAPIDFSRTIINAVPEGGADITIIPDFDASLSGVFIGKFVVTNGSETVKIPSALTVYKKVSMEMPSARIDVNEEMNGEYRALEFTNPTNIDLNYLTFDEIDLGGGAVLVKRDTGNEYFEDKWFYYLFFDARKESPWDSIKAGETVKLIAYGSKYKVNATYNKLQGATPILAILPAGSGSVTASFINLLSDYAITTDMPHKAKYFDVTKTIPVDIIDIYTDNTLLQNKFNFTIEPAMIGNDKKLNFMWESTDNFDLTEIYFIDSIGDVFDWNIIFPINRAPYQKSIAGAGTTTETWPAENILLIQKNINYFGYKNAPAPTIYLEEIIDDSRNMIQNQEFADGMLSFDVNVPAELMNKPIEGSVYVDGTWTKEAVTLNEKMEIPFIIIGGSTLKELIFLNTTISGTSVNASQEMQIDNEIYSYLPFNAYRASLGIYLTSSSSEKTLVREVNGLLIAEETYKVETTDIWNSGITPPGSYNIETVLIIENYGINETLSSIKPLTVLETIAGKIIQPSISGTIVTSASYPTANLKVRNIGNVNKPYTLNYKVNTIAGVTQKTYTQTLSVNPGEVSTEQTQTLDSGAFAGGYGNYNLVVELKGLGGNLLDTDTYLLSYPNPCPGCGGSNGGGGGGGSGSDYIIENNEREEETTTAKKETKPTNPFRNLVQPAANPQAPTGFSIFGLDTPIAIGLLIAAVIAILGSIGAGVYILTRPKIYI